MKTSHDDDWIRKIHMVTWYCDIGHTPLLEFNDEHVFRQHLKDKHKDVTKWQANALVRRKRGVGYRDLVVCPFCERTPKNIPHKMRDQDKLSMLFTHVGDHLKSLAFFSLPSMDSDPVNDGQLSSSGAEPFVGDSEGKQTSRSSDKHSGNDSDMRAIPLEFDEDGAKPLPGDPILPSTEVREGPVLLPQEPPLSEDQAIEWDSYDGLREEDVGDSEVLDEMRRWQERRKRESQNLLKSLPTAAEAPFNSYTRQHEFTCLPNTRVDVLQEIYNWADGQDERCIFWLNGLAGKGKSTVAHTVARRYSEQKRLGASFFFSRGGGDVSHAGKFVTSIAVQFAKNAPPLQHYICEAIKERSDIASKPLQDQWHQLVLRPLSKLNGGSCRFSYILVVDALDECDDDNNIRIIIQLLTEARSLETVRLRIFITSRPETPIRHGFSQIQEAEHQDFVLHNVLPAIVDHDISLFLENKLEMIRQECHLASGWPGERNIKRLVQSANGLFIWAATACRFILEGRTFAADRLSIVLKDDSMDDFSTDDSSIDDSPIGDSTIAPEEQLNKIYITVLKHSVRNYKKQERKKWYKLLRQTAGTIILLFSPLSAFSLAGLLDLRGKDIIQILDNLHSILDIPEDRARPIRLHHPSFRDFLLNKQRCGDSNFWVDEKQAHQTLAANCIRLMSTSLKEDIYGLGAPGVLVTNISSSQVEQCLPPEVQYACLNWVHHLQKCDTRLYDNDQVHQFLQVHLLHWLEALSWTRKVSEGIYAITSLESIAHVSLHLQQMGSYLT
jgi:hypothetical protein